MTSYRIMRKNNWKKVEIQDSMGKTKFLFNTLPFSPCTFLATWLHVGVLNLQPILKKYLPCAHTELELDTLGVAGKLVRFVVHSFERNN
jgi:hypothetical protein